MEQKRKRGDLTGMRFGYLSVLRRAPSHITSGGHSLAVWECRCDCGAMTSVVAGKLRTGATRSCGRCNLVPGKRDFVDLTGHRFGYLTVICRAENHVSSGGHSFVSWECACDCGNTVVVTAGHLKTGHNRSCGKCGKFSAFVDLTGRRFGRLVVTGISDEWYTYPNGERDFKWVCKCDCGNMTIRRGGSLRNTKVCQSCGCWRKEESVRDEDMIGHRFGKCVVISRARRISVGNNSTVDAWNCVCDCGENFVGRGPQLRFGKLTSCGCASTSKWEMWLSEFFDSHGIVYDTQKFYPGLFGVGGGYLLYDFCVHFLLGDVLVECQGPQHYHPVDYFGGQDVFDRQVEHDARKREYAAEHNMKLIELNCSVSMCRTHYLDMLQSVFGPYIDGVYSE